MTNNIWNTPYSSANGQLLIGKNSNSPNWTTITQGTGTTITSGAGSITINFAAATEKDFVLLSTVTASSSASITFTGLSSTYSIYMIDIYKIDPVDANVFLYMRTSTNNGSSYDNGASDYRWDMYYAETILGITSLNDTADAQIRLAGDIGAGLNNQGSGTVWLFQPSNADYAKIYCRYKNSTTDETFYSSGMRLAAADVDAIQFFISSGGILTGIFKLYGLKG